MKIYLVYLSGRNDETMTFDIFSRKKAALKYFGNLKEFYKDEKDARKLSCTLCVSSPSGRMIHSDFIAEHTFIHKRNKSLTSK